jgi:hypothetical protein
MLFFLYRLIQRFASTSSLSDGDLVILIVQPLEEKLGQLKVAAQGKLESIADSANQSLNKAQTTAENKYVPLQPILVFAS